MDYIPPHDLKSEKAVLSSLITYEESYDKISDIFTPDVFYNTNHKIIATAIYNLALKKDKIDIITVSNELKRCNQFDFIGGFYELSLLTNEMSFHIESYYAIIFEKYIARESIRISNEALSRAYSGELNGSEIIDELETKIDSIKKNITTSKTRDTRDIVNEALKNIHTAKNNNGNIGPSTGLKALDAVLRGLRRKSVYVIAGRPAMGKEQPLSSKILTPFGWTTMGEINIGDKICGSDGNQYNVTGVFPQGIKDVYEVVFDDGTKTKCGLEHLWEVSDRKIRKSVDFKHKKRVITLNEIIKEGVFVKNSNRKNFSVKMVNPIHFNEKRLEIHPYLLGIYLSEGNSDNHSVRISNPEKEIEEKINFCLHKNDRLKSFKDKTGFRINGGNLLKELKNLGLCGLVSYQKFIPSDYLFSSVYHRLLLLQGILDGDGYVATNNYIEYSTTSSMLRDNVIELARSLGGRATYIERIGRYKKDNVYVKTRVNYRVYISFDKSICPVSTKKHLEKYNNTKKYHHKFISQINKVEPEECKCIMVDSPDNCYITDDYIVTHNTAIVMAIAKALAIEQNIPVGVFELEMEDVQLVYRLLSDLSEIDNNKLLSGDLNEYEKRKLDFAQQKITNNLFIDHTPSITIQYIEKKVREWSKNGLQYIIIDYLQLMEITDRDRKGKNREQEIAFITKNLKRIAKKYNIGVIELSQLSRACEERDPPRPMLSDLRESGAIEQDADVVMFLYRPEYYNIEFGSNGKPTKGLAEIIIAKHRNGPIDGVLVRYKGEYTRFEDIEELKVETMSDVNTGGTVLF